MDIRALRGKRVTIMGLGVNGGGVGVARFLAAAGARVLVTDLKPRRELAASIAALRAFRNIRYVLGEHRERDFAAADLVVQNPGVPRDSRYLAIARDHHVPIVTDIQLFLERCPSRHIIAVTGTKGKSTTTALIAAMLCAARRPTIVAGNIGISVLDALAHITARSWVVLEISSWQLEGIRDATFAPSVGVITNILPDHLDRYASFEEYADVKRSLVAHQTASDIAVLNADDTRVRGAGRGAAAAVRWFSRRRPVVSGCVIRGGWIVAKDGRRATRIMPLREISLLGDHNVANVLAAATAALAVGIPPAAIRRAVRGFRGIPHRLEVVRNYRGVRYVNDSAATMPDAVVAALRAFGAPIILICGGRDKGLDYARIVHVFVHHRRLRALVLLANPAYSASAKLSQLMAESPRFVIHQKYPIKTPAGCRVVYKSTRKRCVDVVGAGNMREAVALAAALAQRGDVVLLSPGAASFGMFRNEFDRGDQFRAAVRAL